MKKHTLKVSKWIYTFLAGALGFAQSCGPMMAEYGTPNADFTFSGKVTDNTGNPIEGIEITGKDHDNEFTDNYDPTTYTGKNGEYTLHHQDAFPVRTYYLRYRDVDGELNGSFGTVEKEITIDNTDYTGKSDGWFKGYVKITVNTTLEENKPDENAE